MGFLCSFSLPLWNVLLPACFYLQVAASTCAADSRGNLASGDADDTRAVNVLFVLPAAEDCAGAGDGAGVEQELLRAAGLAVDHVNADSTCNLNGQKLQLFTESSQVANGSLHE